MAMSAIHVLRCYQREGSALSAFHPGRWGPPSILGAEAYTKGLELWSCFLCHTQRHLCIGQFFN